MTKTLWTLLIIAALLGCIWSFFPLSNGEAQMQTLPLTGPHFYGKDLPLSEFEKTQLPNVGILKRLYRVDTQNFLVTVLDGTHNRHAVHDPRYCFRGEGWAIVNEKPFTLPYGEGNLFTLKRGIIEREALAWFTQGNFQFASPLQFWLLTSLRRLTLGFSGPEPLLVLVQPMDEEKPDWQTLMDKFKPLFSF